MNHQTQVADAHVSRHTSEPCLNVAALTEPAHAPYKPTSLGHWIDGLIAEGASDSDITIALRSPEALLELGFAPSVMALVAAYRARCTPTTDSVETGCASGSERPGETLLKTVIIPEASNDLVEDAGEPGAPWPVRVERGAWGGLLIFVGRPTGIESCLHVEATKDKISVKMWPDVDGDVDQATIVRIGDDGFTFDR